MNPADIRMCRLDGQQPTTRERWTAFYRLWRMARRTRKSNECHSAVHDCFGVLMADWKWLILVEGCGDRLTIRLPKFLRRSFVENERTRRLMWEA